MNINWTRVTRTSQLLAIVLFVGVFALGFFLGKEYEHRTFLNGLKDMHLVPAP